MSLELRIDRAARARAVLVLAHGAGAGMDTPIMSALAHGLASAGISVVRFEFAYMAARRETGRRAPPDRMPALEARFGEVARALTTARLRKPLFLGGRSMGGRVATHVADTLSARGVIAYSYPFHPPRRSDTLRVEHLAGLATPCLIVQGTRDPFGTPDEVARYPLGEKLRVHWLEDGDHAFVPRRQSGRTSAQNIAEAVEVTARFVTDVLEGRT
jgi:predicted alpha/beta-hydrolase family hydrolase